MAQVLPPVVQYSATFDTSVIRIFFVPGNSLKGQATVTIVGKCENLSAEWSLKGDTLDLISDRTPSMSFSAVVNDLDGLEAKVVLDGKPKQLYFGIDTSFEQQLHLFKRRIKLAVASESRSALQALLHQGVTIVTPGRITTLKDHAPSWVFDRIRRKDFKHSIAASSAFEDQEFHGMYLLGLNGEIAIEGSETLGVNQYEVSSIDFSRQ